MGILFLYYFCADIKKNELTGKQKPDKVPHIVLDLIFYKKF